MTSWAPTLRALLLLPLVVGCAPQLSLGEPCALPSDCPVPLTCLLDRCRSECETDRDCDDDAVCLLDEVNGARACRTPNELTCVAAEDCGGALTCSRGRCAQRCDETAECGGTVCANEDDVRVCVEPTGGACSDDGECAFGICDGGRCDEVRDLDAGSFGTCLLLDSGRLVCAGGNNASFLTGDPSVRFVPSFEPVLDAAGSQPPFEAIEIGSAHGCALAAGRVRCWGDGSVGQNGAGATTPPIPSPLSVLSGVRELAVAFDTSCARTDDAVFCFGWDQFGQLGDTATHGTAPAASAAPVRVELPAGVVPARLHISGFHACIVDTVGAVYCWGGNDYAQIRPTASATCMQADTAYGCEPTPVRIDGYGPGERRAVQAVVGQSHTCILDDTGAVRCFGQNRFGQLGAGPIMESVPTAVMPFATGVTAIDAGRYYTCALLSDGRLSCWGANAAGQLGTGAGSASITPTDVDFELAGGARIVDFTCGDEHACALDSQGAVYCWGSANDGRLGDDPSGPALRSPVPVPARVSAGAGAR